MLVGFGVEVGGISIEVVVGRGVKVAVGTLVERAVVTGSAARVVGVETAVVGVGVSDSIGVQAPKRIRAMISI